MSFGKLPRRWSQAIFRQHAKQEGIHDGNPESGKHHGTITLIKLVEILTKHIRSVTNRRERGEGAKPGASLTFEVGGFW